LGREVFRRLDADGDGRLDAAELARWPAQPPDLELFAPFGKDAGQDIEVVEPERRHPSLAVSRAGDGRLLVRCPGTPLEWLRTVGSRVNVEAIRKAYLARFQQADGNGNGVLDKEEIFREPFEFLGVSRLADRDGDGKVTEKELTAYLDLQEKGFQA